MVCQNTACQSSDVVLCESASVKGMASSIPAKFGARYRIGEPVSARVF